MRLIETAQTVHSAVQIDRPVIPLRPQQGDDALRLTEGVGADKMRPPRLGFQGINQAIYFTGGRRMPEDRQGKRGLGDQQVARHAFKSRASRIRYGFVIPGDNNSPAFMLQEHLCAAQNMTGGMKTEGHVSKGQILPVRQRLETARAIGTVARLHNGNGFGGCQYTSMSGPGMVGMAMCDYRLADRPVGVDINSDGGKKKRMVNNRHRSANRAKTPPLPVPSPSSLPGCLADHPLTAWMAGNGWAWHIHQIDTLVAARAGRDVLLTAPTGAGKTLAGFLPSLVDMYEMPPTDGSTLHTLYVSPLKALAVDVHRNLSRPVDAMGLPITHETRTGDTPQSKKQRQKRKPPHILLTTPESLALLLSHEEAPRTFAGLRHVVIDELHAVMHSKRGDLLSLGLARLTRLAPQARRIALSATLDGPETAAAYACREDATIVTAPAALRPKVRILIGRDRMPWSGHMARYALGDVYAELKEARLAIVFVNTRAQAELVFRELWDLNDDRLRIALHHGSLERDQRRRVEEAMASGGLDCVIATSSLDLGLDWAAVDLVVQIGAPKGASRLLQRIGRSNHRLDTPSRAILVPANRFEYLECMAACQAIDGQTLDGPAPRAGGLDVLAQHILGRGCMGPFEADDLFDEVRRAWPYRDLRREDFDGALHFMVNGGYALKTYDRYGRLETLDDGRYRVRDNRHRQRYAMNIGTIVEAPMLKVKIGKRTLGQIEDYFIQGLSAGDTFLFGGQVLRFEGLRDGAVQARRSTDGEAKIPSYAGGKLPLTTHLSTLVRHMLNRPGDWRRFPAPVAEWLHLQGERSALPSRDGLLVETFPRAGRHHLVAYGFEGRNAHHTLGFLLLRRMQRFALKPLGFVATDYAVAVWSLEPVDDADQLFAADLMVDDLQDWLEETPLLKRLFREVAVIAGLIDRQMPGARKTGKQVTFNADLIYDVLRRYEPDHILLKAARADAGGGLIDLERLQDMLVRIQGRIDHRRLDRVSPLAVPLLLEINRETIPRDEMGETVLADFERSLLEEAALDTVG